MSMNLIFDVKGGVGSVDFPYQTRTELTYAVLAEKDPAKQLKLIHDDIEFLFDPEIREGIMNEVKALWASPNLEISII